MAIQHLSNAEKYKRAVAIQAKRSGRTPTDSYNLRRLRRKYGIGSPNYKPGYLESSKQTRDSNQTAPTHRQRGTHPLSIQRGTRPFPTPIKVTPAPSKPITNPSTVYAAMGINVNADTSSHKWDTKPIRTYDGNQIYVHPVNRIHYILNTDGQIAQYDWRHKKLAEVGKEDTNKYPSWFDAKTIAFIKNMGGLSSDPYYNRR